MRWTILGATLGVWLTCGLCAAKTPDEDDPTAELVQAERDMIAAMVRGDADALGRALAPDYIHTNLVGGRTDKRQEIEEFYTPDRFRLQGGDVKVVNTRRYGDIAILWADLTWNGAVYTPPGRAPINLSGVYSVTNVFHRVDGRWLLVAGHASRPPFAPAPVPPQAK